MPPSSTAFLKAKAAARNAADLAFAFALIWGGCLLIGLASMGG